MGRRTIQRAPAQHNLVWLKKPGGLSRRVFIYLFTSQCLPGEFRIIPELMEINPFSRESPESPGKTDFLPVSVFAHLMWSYFLFPPQLLISCWDWERCVPHLPFSFIPASLHEMWIKLDLLTWPPCFLARETQAFPLSLLCCTRPSGLCTDPWPTPKIYKWLIVSNNNVMCKKTKKKKKKDGWRVNGFPGATLCSSHFDQGRIDENHCGRSPGRMLELLRRMRTGSGAHLVGLRADRLS